MENWQKYMIESNPFDSESWKEELTHWFTEVITLYMKYYSEGKLEKIYVGADPEMDIFLTIDGKEEHVNLDMFKLAEEEQERDRQRECYFANEAMISEFFMYGEEICHPFLKSVMEEVSKHFGVPYELEYFGEE